MTPANPYLVSGADGLALKRKLVQEKELGTAP